MAFKVGMKVCCVVSGSGWHEVHDRHVNSEGPQKGDVVEIAHIWDTPDASGGSALSFVEWPKNWYFGSANFRPLVSTNIDIFHSILANPHKELENA